MNTMQRIQSVVLLISMIAMIALIAALAGCERDDQIVDTAERQAPAGETAGDQTTRDRPVEDQQPLEHAVEFDGFTLRANVSRTDVLPEAMTRQYGIEPESNHVLLNVVILEDRPDGRSVPVSAEVNAHYESLSGHVEFIDMRAVEANSHVSYIGTLDASGQRVFQLVIEAQPAGTDEPFHMDFEVQLEAFEAGDSE